MNRIGELLFALKRLNAQAVSDRQSPESHDEKEHASDTHDRGGSESDGEVGVDVKDLSITPPGWNAPLLKGGSTNSSIAQIVVVFIDSFSFPTFPSSSNFSPISDTSSTSSFFDTCLPLLHGTPFAPLQMCPSS